MLLPTTAYEKDSEITVHEVPLIYINTLFHFVFNKKKNLFVHTWLCVLMLNLMDLSSDSTEL